MDCGILWTFRIYVQLLKFRIGRGFKGLRLGFYADYFMYRKILLGAKVQQLFQLVEDFSMCEQ